MAYGLSTRVFIEGGPVEQVAKIDQLRSTARSWRILSHECRFALVEQAVANDRIDAFPIAL